MKKPVPKVPMRRTVVHVRLLRELVTEIDRIARTERRSRSNAIEVLIDRGVRATDQASV